MEDVVGIMGVDHGVGAYTGDSANTHYLGYSGSCVEVVSFRVTLF